MNIHPTDSEIDAYANRSSKVVLDVLDERAEQRKNWSAEHDDQHDAADWARLITEYASSAREVIDKNMCRRRLVQVAALAVAAVESLDRKPKSSEECLQRVVAAARRVNNVRFSATENSTYALRELHAALTDLDAATERSVKQSVVKVTE